MVRNRGNHWIWVLFTIWTLAVTAVLAQPGNGVPFAVLDKADMFSEAAEEKANAEIAQIKKRFGKDLLIETMAEAPKEIDKINLKDNSAKSKFFQDLAIERAKKAQVNGVYVLICNDPKIRYVQPVVGAQTHKSGIFTEANRNVLGNKLLTALKNEKPNEGLTEAVTYVKNTMAAQMPATSGQKKSGGPASAPSSRPSGGFSWMGFLCFGIVIFLVIWMVVGLIRAFSGRPRAAAPGGYGNGGYPAPGGGGGGFLPSVLGGLFGGMAGSWMYDRFFRGGSTGHAGSEPPYSGSDYTSPPPSDVGGDYYAGGGGDFGGGGDVGGGGGDTGGGEW